MKIATLIERDSGLSVVKYKEDEFLGNLHNTRLAITPDHTLDYEIKRRIGGRLDRTRISAAGMYFYLYHTNDIVVRETPEPSGSPGSDAKYYIWDDKLGFFLQFIPANSRTSCNYHKVTDETFYNLLGQSSICLCKENNNIQLNGSFSVRPYQCHRLISSSTPAFNIGIMNPPNLGITDHYYPEKCPKGLYSLPTGDYANQKTA